MTKFIELNSRSDLINLFYHRMRYIDGFPTLSDKATRFHKYVGQIPFFREIITTNWDDYFERWADAVPLVHGPDFDYWDLAQRKVLKIHGSVLNPGTIIASRSEYDASLEALGCTWGARPGVRWHTLAVTGRTRKSDGTTFSLIRRPSGRSGGSAPSRIRTCAHGSGGRTQPRL